MGHNKDFFFRPAAGNSAGALICFLRTRKNPVARGIASVYVAILRGTPVLMLLLLLYYGVFARAGLEPVMVAVIRMLAKRDMSMVIVTHEMNFAREVASRVLFFADGGIYEQGTPAEIFDNPQREKTVAFIRKIKYFAFEITERGFDLMQLQGGIQSFGEKYGLDQKRTYRLQLCCEELFGTDRMIEALRSAEEGSPEEILQAVDRAIGDFVNDAPQFDDITMLSLEYNGPQDE